MLHCAHPPEPVGNCYRLGATTNGAVGSTSRLTDPHATALRFVVHHTEACAPRRCRPAVPKAAAGRAYEAAPRVIGCAPEAHPQRDLAVTTLTADPVALK